MSIDEETYVCQWPRCSGIPCIIYLGKGVCEKHWRMIDKLSTEDFKKKLKIKIITEEKCNECEKLIKSRGQESVPERNQEGSEKEKDDICPILQEVQRDEEG